ncbi:Gfo/Idh/MocA family protein [Leeuwenhoekiella sp. A16]|uniref:Gfo/Idh/MocA family protein n=1 Tax=unclassified Leeuwenhoekiella TaxID=2615029 RepID=UPI003A7FC226
MQLETLNKSSVQHLKLGFIGVGWIGRNRMEVLLNNAQADAEIIAETDAKNALEAQKSAPKARKAVSIEEVCKAEIDGVVIATPSAMHAAQCIQSFNAGKSVFCQKPLGRSAAEVKEVVTAAKNADKLLAVDLSYRYTKAFKAVYDLIQSGELGTIFSVNLIFHNAYGPDKPWFYDIHKSGGGCVIDLGIHLIDLAMWALDFPEVEVSTTHLYSRGQKISNIGEQVEDFADVKLIADNHTSINLRCSWHVSAGKDAIIKAEFFGTNGTASFKNINGSFYDFIAEKYTGTSTQTLVNQPDDWSGRAGLVWAQDLLDGKGHNARTAQEFIKIAEIIDEIYGR